jgi:hypothetical protein
MHPVQGTTLSLHDPNLAESLAAATIGPSGNYCTCSQTLPEAAMLALISRQLCQELMDVLMAVHAQWLAVCTPRKAACSVRARS